MPDFLGTTNQNGQTKYTKMAIKIQNGHKIHQHFPFQGLPKHFPKQIGIFGTKIYHLAILLPTLAEILLSKKRISGG
jgi:hypothetical protein